MRRRQVYKICFLFIVENVCLAMADDVMSASVDWYGDPRGPHDNNFYDLVYDESVCQTPLKATAVDGYIFVGGIVLKSFPITMASECLIQCYKTMKCKSVNINHSNQQRSCELNTGSQIEDPKALIVHENGSYYENIQCISPVLETKSENLDPESSNSDDKSKQTLNDERDGKKSYIIRKKIVDAIKGALGRLDNSLGS